MEGAGKITHKNADVNALSRESWVIRIKGLATTWRNRDILKTVMAYATAEEYDLERLKAGLIKQDLYKPVHLCSGDELKHTGIFFLHTIKSTRAWNLMNIKYCELGRAYLIFF
uniref:Uncharacterized protein n=1 Tax=Timema douglasi TaxID=61478 RepID=A0A7R8VY68_TIMDO|nr:unnamed protein product [Timema douglasi]